MLLAIPAGQADALAPVHNALIESFPADIRVTIVAQAEAVARIRDWPCVTARGERVDIINAGSAGITSWARDPLLMAVDSDGAPIVFASPQFGRRDDGRIVELLKGRELGAVQYAACHFEGGNILVGERHVLIGADSIARAEGADEEERLATMAAAFAAVDPNRALLPVASPFPVPAEREMAAGGGDDGWHHQFHFCNVEGTRQPIFHIDIFLSLAGPGADGRERILVGDPAMAADILGQRANPHAMAGHFDAIAGLLARAGYAVTRNPMPLIYCDRPEKRRRIWYFAPLNNVLVERDPERGDIVRMLAFGHDNWPELAAIDDRNRQIWENLGFEVRMIAQGQLLAENLGGLHCLTNVLRRS